VRMAGKAARALLHKKAKALVDAQKPQE